MERQYYKRMLVAQIFVCDVNADISKICFILNILRKGLEAESVTAQCGYMLTNTITYATGDPCPQ
jgi:hypothetical protein